MFSAKSVFKLTVFFFVVFMCHTALYADSLLDTDNDGMPDGWEIIHGLNPLVNDSRLDLDNDALINLYEFTNNTNPLDNDTDNDRLLDGEEKYEIGPINTYTTSDQSYPVITSNDTSYLITWRSKGQDNNNDGVYGQLVSSRGIPINSEFQINTFSNIHYTRPSLTSNGTTYFVTWAKYSYKEGGNALGQLFDNEGNPLGQKL